MWREALTHLRMWIREQVNEWLSLPGLYQELPQILSVRSVESAEIGQKAEALRFLLERWTRLGTHCPDAAQPSASPNGGPAEPPANSGIRSGQPVS